MDLFKRENKELPKFMEDTSVATLTGPAKVSHLLLWITCAFIVISILWAKFAVLDEVTRANGKVIPARQVQLAQNLEGGIVEEILVHEGQTVKPNQVLMNIDDTRFISSYRETKLKAAALAAKITRLLAESQNKAIDFTDKFKKEYPNLMKTEFALYTARKNEFESKLDTLNRQIDQKKHEWEDLKVKLQQLQKNYKLMAKELNLTKPLIKDGAVSEVEVLRLEREVNDMEGQIKSTQINIPRAKAAIDESTSKRNEIVTTMKSQATNELSQTQAEFSQLRETLNALNDRVKRTAVRSPVKGVIKKIHINTVGGVIQPGMDLIEIVPLDDTLLVEANVDPKDIGFLKIGDNAIVKFTAFDYAIYGGLNGIVEHISADSLTDENNETFYLIRVRTDKNYLGEKKGSFAIIPGMQASVDILTGKKSVLAYLLKPILKAREKALRER